MRKCYNVTSLTSHGNSAGQKHGNYLTPILGVLGSNVVRGNVIQTDVYRGFPLSLQARTTTDYSSFISLNITSFRILLINQLRNRQNKHVNVNLYS